MTTNEPTTTNTTAGELKAGDTVVLFHGEVALVRGVKLRKNGRTLGVAVTFTNADGVEVKSTRLFNTDSLVALVV